LEKPDTLSKSQNKKTKIVLDREDVRCYNKNMKEKISLLSDILGSYSGSNDEHLFQCPYCKHHKRKFSVNIKRGVYKCWVCDAKGRSLYRLIRRFGSFKQRETWKALSGEKTDLNGFDSLFEEDEKENFEQILQMPPSFKSLCGNKRFQTPLKYLKDRGIDKKDILKWKMGFCSEGPYQGRIIIPSFNENGDLNYFIARTFTDNYKRYLNPPVSRDIIFNELYVDFDKEVTIVEGAFDAVKAENAIPILGSTIRETSRIFRRIVQNDTPVLLALDPDAKYKAENIKRLFLKYGIEIRELQYDDERDIGDMSKEEVKNLSQNAPFIREDDSLVSAISNL
jgi:DNA primase